MITTYGIIYKEAKSMSTLSCWLQKGMPNYASLHAVYGLFFLCARTVLFFAKPMTFGLRVRKWCTSKHIDNVYLGAVPHLKIDVL